MCAPSAASHLHCYFVLCASPRHVKVLRAQCKASHDAILNPSGAAQNDLDLGSSGAVVIKDKYIMTGGKQGPLYLADAANLGGYSPATNNANVFQACPPIQGYCTLTLYDPPWCLLLTLNAIPRAHLAATTCGPRFMLGC